MVGCRGPQLDAVGPVVEATDGGTLVQTDTEEADATPNPASIQDTTDEPPDGGTIGYMASLRTRRRRWIRPRRRPTPPATTPASRPNDGPAFRPEVVNVPGYEILGILGRGGMGVVYKAKHLKLKRTVALKMVLAGGHASETELACFYIEAEAVAQPAAPNIVQVFEISEQNGLPFFVLEYVDGGSLSKKLDGKPQPPRDAARMVQRSPRRWATRTCTASSTATSSRRTSCSPRRPAQDYRLRPGQAARGGFGADQERHPDGDAELHGARSRPAATPRTSARSPTCTRSASSSTR